MFRKLHYLGIVALLGLFVRQASAQTINTDANGNVVSIENLQIAGTTFKVSFEVDTFANRFGAPAAPDPVPYFWYDGAGADIASQAINDALNSGGFGNTPVSSAGSPIYVVPWHPTSAPTVWFLVKQSSIIPYPLRWANLGNDGVHVTETIPVATFEERLDPVVLADNLLDFMVEATAGGTLSGSGPGKSAGNRLLALYNMIDEAAVLIDLGLIEDACDQLHAALRKTDGDPKPPDFVTGEAALQLADMILELMLVLECGDDEEPPTVISITAIDNTHVEIVYSEPMDKTSVEDNVNYSIIPPLAILGILQDTTQPNRIVINTSPQFAGLPHQISINNVTDLAGNPIDPVLAIFIGVP